MKWGAMVCGSRRIASARGERFSASEEEMIATRGRCLSTATLSRNRLAYDIPAASRRAAGFLHLLDDARALAMADFGR